MNKYTLSYRFLYGNVHGLVFAKNRPVSLNWSDYTRQVLQPFGNGIIPVGMSDEFVTDQIPCLIEQHFTNMRGAQWLSGRVLDSRPKGRGFEPHWRHCVVVLEQDTFILA